MTRRSKSKAPRRLLGQTLVIAVIILAVLLILGIGFAALLNQNIQNTNTGAKRGRSDELADAGVKYAHFQLQFSVQGADWRPEPTVMDGTGDLTKDQDSLYLRPATFLDVAPDPQRPTFKIKDMGGPDFLGAYSRLNFQRGRTLLRVRYGPSNYAALTSANAGFSNPGALRSALVIDSIGRPSTTSSTDPTVQSAEAVKYRNYVDEAELRVAVAKMRSLENQTVDTKRLMAVANLGITEYARSVWNKYGESRPAQIGFPVAGSGGALWVSQTSTGITYEGQPVEPPVLQGNDAGGAATVNGASNSWNNLPGMGSLLVNGDLEVNGVLTVSLNATFGEQVNVSGKIKAANDNSSLTVTSAKYSKPTDQWQLASVSIPANDLDSDSATFDTRGGLVRDGGSNSDANGFPRGISRKEPPSFFAKDPQSGMNRYDVLTRQSGSLNAAGFNIGEWGYGEGVFVDSFERGDRPSGQQRTAQDPSKSLPNDWLNPNNSNSKGWVGPYYIPVASYMELLPDGFRLIRDSRSKSPFWRDPVTGAPTSQSSMRYWLRRYMGSDVTKQNQVFVVDEQAAPAFNPQVSDDAFVAAPGARRFNGVVMCGGDLRVRGVIPTDVQVSVVAQGSLYLEGSVTKGVVTRRSDNGLPELLGRPSRSLALLAARDYVVLNTTQFFAPAPGQSPQAKASENLPDTPSPIELDATKNQVFLHAQFLLDPQGNNPQTWKPFLVDYKTPASLGTPVSLSSNLLFTLAADDDGPAFASMKVAPVSFGQAGPGPLSYLFPGRLNFFDGATYFSTEASNDAGPFFSTPAPPAPPAPWNIPLLGLANNGLNTYPRFQTVANPIFDASDVTYWQSYTAADRSVRPAASNPTGAYHLAVQDPTEIELRLDSVVGQPAKNLLVARTAVAPYDVRVEATVHAEEGSFFVLPGPWFNTNPQDTRARFEAKLVSFGGSTAAVDYGNSVPLAQAQVDRYTTFGNSSEVPFFGEPLDVRVSIVGALSENMTAPMSQQTEWLKKWGFLPRRLGGSGRSIPAQHAAGLDLSVIRYAPNLIVTYDPVLATAYAPNDSTTPLRFNRNGELLPPLPRLPVSPTLAYIGEARP